MKSRNIEHHSRNVNKRLGETVTVVNYTFTGSYDDYNDPEFTTSTTEVEAEVYHPEQARARTTAQGQKVDVELVIYVDDDVTVVGPDDAEDADDPMRPTEFRIVDEDNADYRTVYVGRYAGRLGCEVVSR